MDLGEKILMLGIGGALIYLIMTRSQAPATTAPAQPQQIVTSAPGTYVEIPVPTYPPEYPETPEEPMGYGAPEETGEGGYTPIVTSMGECFNECLMAGYLNGSCMWPSEAPSGAVNIIECMIPGSRHCGDVGMCGCYCWGSYEG